MNTIKNFIIGSAVYCFIGLLGIMTVCKLIEIFALYKSDIQIILAAILISVIAIKGYSLIETYINKTNRKRKRK